MQQDDITTVYSYLTYDSRTEGESVARYKAPRDVIVERLGGQVLEGTAHDVPRAELDELGRYRRVATGWGELT